MLKSELRLLFTERRNALQEKEITASSLLISNQLLKLPIWSFSFFHLFLPILEKKEIDTSYVLTILQGKDKNVVVPKMQDNNLINYLLTDNTLLRKNRWNVPEPVEGILIAPEQIEVVFIPLLAFDKQGNRVGYGKGYYDRFLKQCKADVIKIGLSFFDAEEEISDVFEADIPLDYCVTPKKIYSFSIS
ncbi:5-formyltetrahydrofolate cyclo-ligase [Maribacter sp. HTCC2170]|uniref:5-formyltetrahydrofolate cyclo-ligase n=1 Tax=Maribacter sp. (strain HTCC2170 / KCCM 42371) TaxID=313603 RepID=UPI00006BD32F|nr:5-formyltetrahydrofolate cyclo-ligase [Maribacter sp. HTCC2170]EAR03042.1 5-formyltetrahydrofolate cyclo-ligase, putative [Maribacter sp. HTCC2170]